jgi:hypothetical protein
VGTIQVLEQHIGSVTISSQNYGYDESLFQVFFDGNQVPFSILDEGMVVRFYVNTDNMITRMELLGPIDRIREFFQS